VTNEIKHCTQYSICGGVTIFGTARLSDGEVRAAAKRDLVNSVERFDRCPVCEEWTTIGGQLRSDVDCPAVIAEISAPYNAANQWLVR